MASQNHLYLVDGSGYIFRAYHRLPPLTNIRGEPVGAVYGYTTMLWKLADALHKTDGPTHMAVILDKSGHTFRNDLYDQYKANRPPPPEDLVPQFPMIRDATRAFSLPCIEEQGLEADDIIAAYAKAATAEGWRVTIVSSDKDLMQLMTDPLVDMLDTMNNRTLGPDYVREKFGVGPEQLGDVLALMGDSVDNVPGVKGVGPKTASKLLIEYGDLDSVLAAAPDMKPSKLRDNLIEFADNARLSKTLVTLHSEAPLPEPLDDLVLKEIPEEPLRDFLEHHGFKSLLNRLGGDKPMADRTTMSMLSEQLSGGPATSALPATPTEQLPFERERYDCVTTLEVLDRWIAEATKLGVVAVDTETTGIDATQADLVGISLATAPNKACYIPLGHGGTDLLSEKPEQIEQAEAIARLKPLLEDPAVLKIGHNIKYDLTILGRAGLDVAPYDDSILMSFDLEAGLHGHGMDELSQLHLDHQPIAYKDVVGTGKKQLTFNEVDLKTATQYAAEDADITWRLWDRLRPRLHSEQVTRVYELVDRPLPSVIAQMERHGVKVDAAKLKQLSSDFAQQAAALETEIHAIAGSPFTVGSPKQLGEILYDQMGLKGGRKGKSGVYSTDVNELERIAAQRENPEAAEMVRKILDWRQLTKLKSTYTDALQAQINPATGRVHTSYSLTGAQTGRLSSTDPNLQNIPIRTETGRQIREAFIAEPGNVLLSADYSQIELRLAAEMCNVPALKDAFARGEDIHAATAQELFGEVNRDTRGRAKTINFSILYGISRWGLASRLEISPDEAQDMISRYYERFPGIAAYVADTIETTRARGYTETLFGRRTHFRYINDKVQHVRQGAERAAINAPIQGTSADIIKRAMARMDKALADAGLHDVKMLLQVHDELVFELPEDQVDLATPVIQTVMASAAEPMVKLSVPLVVEVGSGKNWESAH